MKTLLGSIAAPFCLALAVTTSASAAGNMKFSPDLQPTGSTANVEVIVQYKIMPTEAHRRKVRSLGGTVHETMNHVKAGHYTVPVAALETLAEDPDVLYISPNRPLRGALNITAATVHSDVANAQGYTGSGIGVAVIDSGMSDMPEFHNGQSRIVYQQSFVENLPNLNMNCPGGRQRRRAPGSVPRSAAEVALRALQPGSHVGQAARGVERLNGATGTRHGHPHCANLRAPSVHPQRDRFHG